MFPYFCPRCCYRYKTQSNFSEHACKRENNTTATSRFVSNDELPWKMPTAMEGHAPAEESLSASEVETDGVRDDDYYGDDLTDDCIE